MAQDDRTPHSRFPKIVYVIVALALLAVLAVGLILFIPIKPHFPPEDPDITAKRLSPENGFYALAEAAEMDKASWNRIPEAINEYWESGWPEDPDNERLLVEYLDSLAPVFAKMREGFEAEYFLLPEIADPLSQALSNVNLFSGWRDMARMLVAQAKWSETQGRYEEAMDNYLDAARLGMTIGSDGSMINALVGVAVIGIGMNPLNESLPGYNDPEILRDALEEMKDIAQLEVPLSKILEFEMREYDKMLISQLSSLRGFFSPSNPASPPTALDYLESPLVNFFYKISAIRFSHSRGRFYDDFMKAADRPYPEYVEIRPDVPKDFLSSMLFNVLTTFPQTRAGQRTWLRGTLVSLALQIYYCDHGEYPDTLDVLVPTYLDELPMDPFTGEPFHYENMAGDFRLYSYGRNGVDDGGTGAWLDGDQIIHLPAEEWEEMEAEE